MKKRLTIVFLFVSTWVSATNYYVATTGKDSNPGTLSQPWGTWGKAFSTAVAGDTVFFRGGVYKKPSNVTDYSITHSGTSSKRIVFINYPGEVPILDGGHFRPQGTTAEYNSGIYVSNKSYIDIIGLTIRNLLQANGQSANNHRGIQVYNSNQVRIINCTVHNTSGYAIDVVYDGNSGGAKNYVINCDTYNIIDTLSAAGYRGGTGTGISGGSWRSGVATDAILYVSGCRAWNCSDQGFALSLDGSIVADSCWSWGNTGYYMSNGSLISFDSGDGIGFKLGWATIETSSIRRTITRCIAAFNNQYGFGTNDPSWMGYKAVPMQICNNLAYNTRLWGFWAVKTSSSASVEATKVFRNNISIGSGQNNWYNPDNANVTHDHNSWNAGYSVSSNDFIKLPSSLEECHAILGAPRKANGALPDIGDYFKLKGTAKAIDAGADVGLPYKGNAPDLGPFEYSSETTSPAIPQFKNAVIENATPARLEMNYSLTLANITPATSAFTVRVNGNNRAVNAVAISGTRVMLTLASPVEYGNTVTVAYNKPTTNPLQTSAGAQADPLPATNVTNNVAAILPVFTGAVIENATPARLEMNYSLTLANITPATSAFTVRVNGNNRAVNAVAISGTRVMLTLASPVEYGNTVTVAYNKPTTNPLQTTAGAQAEPLPATNATNNVAAANQPPEVNISSPTKGNAFVAPATITIDAVAYDPDGTIVKVEFYNGPTKLGESTAPPYFFTWKEVPAGTYTFTAAATDNMNTRTLSAPVTVVVEKAAPGINQRPIIHFRYPNKNRKYRKYEFLTLAAEASDPDGTISKVWFKNGDVTIAELTEAPYIYEWQIPDTGSYSITAVAADNLGATTESSNFEFRAIEEDGPGFGISRLYPNPTDGYFTVDMSDITEDDWKFTIYSLTGQVLNIEQRPGYETTIDFEFPDLPAGTYILVVSCKDIILDSKTFIKR